MTISLLRKQLSWLAVSHVCQSYAKDLNVINPLMLYSKSEGTEKISSNFCMDGWKTITYLSAHFVYEFLDSDFTSIPKKILLVT